MPAPEHETRDPVEVDSPPAWLRILIRQCIEVNTTASRHCCDRRAPTQRLRFSPDPRAPPMRAMIAAEPPLCGLIGTGLNRSLTLSGVAANWCGRGHSPGSAGLRGKADEHSPRWSRTNLRIRSIESCFANTRTQNTPAKQAVSGARRNPHIQATRYPFFRDLSENWTLRRMRVRGVSEMPTIRPRKKTRRTAIARSPGRPVKPSPKLSSRPSPPCRDRRTRAQARRSRSCDCRRAQIP